MFHKDTFRLIKKTFKRFFSLVMIVLIGVAFMMGLLSTREIMEKSVDTYSDDTHLQDIQVYSSYGFDDDDINAIEELEYTDRIFASKAADVYAESRNGSILVARIEETERDVCRFELIDGRMPESPDEVLMLDNSMNKGSMKTGITYRLFLEDKDISETLSTDTFTVVGIVKTPDHMAKTLGPGTMKNLQLDVILYALPEVFCEDYYSTVYFTVKGAAELETFEQEYKDFMQEYTDEFSAFAKKQQEVRKDSLIAEYSSKIEDGERELEEQREEGQRQLDDAKQQLEDARVQILAAETQIGSINTALDTLQARQYSLTSDYYSGSGSVYDRIEEIEDEDEEGRDFNTIYASVAADRASVIAMRDMIDDSDELVAQALTATIESIESKYDGNLEEINDEYTRIFQDKLYYDALGREIELANTAIYSLRSELARMETELEEGKEEYESGLIEYKDAEQTFKTEIEKAEIELRKAKQDLAELPEASWMILSRDSHYSSAMYTQNAKQMGAIGVSLPLLFYLVAALVCLTTMTRLIDEQRGQIGIFRALGFSRGKIISKYVIYALLATIIGSTLGIFSGMAIFPVVIYETWRLMYDLPEALYFFPVKNIVICYLAFSVLMAGVTTYVANKSLREMPSQLMRPKAPKNARKILLEKIPLIWKRLSFTGRITARNLIRYKARALMTIIGVAGCTGLLVVGWGIKDSIKDVVSIQYGQIFNYDYTISLENSNAAQDILDVLGEDLYNTKTVPYMSYSSKVYLDDSEPTINVIVVDAREGSDILALRETDKTTPLRIRNGGVIVSEKFAKNNGIKAGDYITFESASGLKAKAKVNEVCEMYFQHYIFISEDQYDLLFDEPVKYTAIAVRNSEESTAEVSAQVKDIEGYSSIADFSSFEKQFNTMLEALDYIILVIIITAGSLAFVVLINLTQVNISERIREIATLKVLGFHNAEVSSYIYKEIFLLTLIGAAAGLPLGVVEHRFIMTQINMDMIMFGTQVKPLSFVYAFAVTIVFTLIVMLIMLKDLRRVEMVESLKSVE